MVSSLELAIVGFTVRCVDVPAEGVAAILHLRDALPELVGCIGKWCGMG